MGLEKIGKEKRCQEKINQEMTRSTAVTGSTGMIVWANDTPLHPTPPHPLFNVYVCQWMRAILGLQMPIPLHPTPPPVQPVCLQMYV